MIKHEKLLVSILILYAQSFPCHKELRQKGSALPLDQVKQTSYSFIIFTKMKAIKTFSNQDVTIHLHDFCERQLAYEKNCFLLYSR